ncbi:MAG: ADP-ribosylglycohydrolase family protein [Candidatus Peribacteria bacterium]|nr:MAG: ADP-ribosylglycohydrolase family protein [Candidatus Peribacteria bacterium]
MEHRYTGEQSIEQVRASQAAREDPGNAPVMRAVPFGFVDESLHQTYAIINADSTHPHPLAREASLMIIKATHHLLVQQRSKETLIPALKPYLQTCTYEKLLQISQLPTPNGLQTQDYVLLCGQQPIPYMQQK